MIYETAQEAKEAAESLHASLSPPPERDDYVLMQNVHCEPEVDWSKAPAGKDKIPDDAYTGRWIVFVSRAWKAYVDGDKYGNWVMIEPDSISDKHDWRVLDDNASQTLERLRESVH